MNPQLMAWKSKRW